MSNKQFRLYDVGSAYLTRCGIESNDGECYENITECCELLNNLHEKNEILRERLNDKDALLIKELTINENLMKRIRELEGE